MGNQDPRELVRKEAGTRTLALARSFSPRLQSHPRVVLRASAPRAWVCDLAQGGEVGLAQQGVEWQLELQVSGEGERVFGGFA